MSLDATARRRWFGAGALLAAIAMLAAGETILQGRLSDAGFLVYWLVCFVLTGLAIIVAFRDARELRRRIHQEQQDLVDSTMQDIEREAKRRPPRSDRLL